MRSSLGLFRPEWAGLVQNFGAGPIFASAFKNRQIRWISAENHSKTMKKILITGGTDGIGKEATLRLAADNFDITISGRDEQKAKSVIEQCQRNHNNTPRFIKTDLSLMPEVIKFANQVAEENFDICILNAGVMMPKQAATPDGRDSTIMTNLISSYMIANRIIENRSAKEEKKPLHLVFSTSILVKFHFATPLGLRVFNPKKASDWEKSLECSEVSGPLKYAISKIGLATLSSSISLRGACENVTATSVHPGTVYTNIMSNLPARQQMYIKLARPFITSLGDAGDNLIRAAMSPLPCGKYYQTKNAKKLPDPVFDEKSIEAFEHVFEQFKIK